MEKIVYKSGEEALSSGTNDELGATAQLESAPSEELDFEQEATMAADELEKMGVILSRIMAQAQQ